MRKNKSDLVTVFSFVQRLTHWVNMAGFFLLMLTGILLYVPALQGMAVGPAGWLARAGHRWGAVIVAAAVLVYLLFDIRGMRRSLREIFSWGDNDWNWALAAPRYYFYGDDSHMPPQGRFNTGQKIFYLTYVLALVVLGVTGLIMWVAKGAVSPKVFQLSVLLHDLAAVVIIFFMLIYLYLAAAHPAMRATMDAMRFGFLPKKYLRHHHARYYEELFPK